MCLQTPYLNYPVIPQGPKHLYLLSDFIVILSFRSVCQLCGWTVPTSGPKCFSDALRHQSEVLCLLWTVVTLSSPRSTIRAVGSMSVRPVRSTILLSDVCQTVHSVGSFHLPFRLPFLLSFALSSALSLSFPFLSPLPQTLAEIIFR